MAPEDREEVMNYVVEQMDSIEEYTIENLMSELIDHMQESYGKDWEEIEVSGYLFAGGGSYNDCTKGVRLGYVLNSFKFDRVRPKVKVAMSNHKVCIYDNGEILFTNFDGELDLKEELIEDLKGELEATNVSNAIEYLTEDLASYIGQGFYDDAGLDLAVALSDSATELSLDLIIERTNNDQVLLGIVDNDNSTLDMLNTIAMKTMDKSVLSAIIEYTDIKQETLNTIADKSRNKDILRAVAKHDNASHETFERLAINLKSELSHQILIDILTKFP